MSNGILESVWVAYSFYDTQLRPIGLFPTRREARLAASKEQCCDDYAYAKRNGWVDVRRYDLAGKK